MVSLTTSTRPVKAKEIERAWHLLDAKGQVLGRLATEAAQKLIGKHKLNYVNYLDMGDHVVVINTHEVIVTGKKEEQKLYKRYSGYPGGLKEIPYKVLKEKRPEQIIRLAVWGMLPKNKLRKTRISRLHIYVGEDHPHGDKLQESSTK